MPFYKKKPVVIEAMQFTGENMHEITEWMGRDYITGPNADTFFVKTIDGTMRVGVTDFVLKGAWGDYYPYPAGTFHETYQEINVPA